MPLATLYDTVKQRLVTSDQLLSNTRWLVIAEAVARASRLLTVIVLAASLSTSEYGVAMLSMVCHEMIRLLTRIGAGAKVIQCSDEELAGYARNVITLNWLVCVLLAVLQCTLAKPLAAFYDSPQLAELLQIMAISYVIYPIVTMRVYLLQRDQQMKTYSLCSAAAICADNLSTVLFVWMGMGLYAVALAKIVAALVWVIGFRRCQNESFSAGFDFAIIKRLLNFSSKVLCGELIKSSRSQIDILLAGKLLSPEAFGLYSFAKSAGVGLGQSLGNAYLAAVYPRLSEAARTQQLKQSITRSYQLAGGLSLLFLAQSLSAVIYIPLLFGERWSEASLLVSILCLTAIPALFIDVTALIYRVRLQLKREIVLQALAVLAVVLGIVWFVPSSALDLALIVLTASWVWLAMSAASFYRQQVSDFSYLLLKRVRLC